MSQSECVCFEKKLAYHTAPTLLGIKAASLISLSNNEFDISEHVIYFNSRIFARNLRMRVLCCCDKRSLILIYNEKLMKERLNRADVIELLYSFGYTDCHSIDEYLDMLSSRISEKGDFPHEIGIFLDYPVEDVIGFIENKGQNFKISGYWKVYGDAKKAAGTFKNYNKCREYLCNKLISGTDIYQALRIS